MNNIQDEIMNCLKDYTQDVQDGIREAAEKNANLGVKTLRKSGPIDSGDYRKGWGKVKTKNGYVIKNKHYRLTHLLEKGHATANGTGRVNGITHIAPVENKVVKQFMNDIIEVVGK